MAYSRSPAASRAPLVFSISKPRSHWDHLSLVELVEVELASVYRYAAGLAPYLRCAAQIHTPSEVSMYSWMSACSLSKAEGPESEAIFF